MELLLQCPALAAHAGRWEQYGTYATQKFSHDTVPLPIVLFGAKVAVRYYVELIVKLQHLADVLHEIDDVSLIETTGLRAHFRLLL